MIRNRDAIKASAVVLSMGGIRRGTIMKNEVVVLVTSILVILEGILLGFECNLFSLHPSRPQECLLSEVGEWSSGALTSSILSIIDSHVVRVEVAVVRIQAFQLHVDEI